MASVAVLVARWARPFWNYPRAAPKGGGWWIFGEMDPDGVWMDLENLWIDLTRMEFNGKYIEIYIYMEIYMEIYGNQNFQNAMKTNI